MPELILALVNKGQIYKNIVVGNSIICFYREGDYDFNSSYDPYYSLEDHTNEIKSLLNMFSESKLFTVNYYDNIDTLKSNCSEIKLDLSKYKYFSYILTNKLEFGCAILTNEKSLDIKMTNILLLIKKCLPWKCFYLDSYDKYDLKKLTNKRVMLYNYDLLDNKKTNSTKVMETDKDNTLNFYIIDLELGTIEKVEFCLHHYCDSIHRDERFFIEYFNNIKKQIQIQIPRLRLNRCVYHNRDIIIINSNLNDFVVFNRNNYNFTVYDVKVSRFLSVNHNCF